MFGLDIGDDRVMCLVAANLTVHMRALDKCLHGHASGESALADFATSEAMQDFLTAVKIAYERESGKRLCQCGDCLLRLGSLASFMAISVMTNQEISYAPPKN